jgi:hypothetical protein
MMIDPKGAKPTFGGIGMPSTLAMMKGIGNLNSSHNTKYSTKNLEDTSCQIGLFIE